MTYVRIISDSNLNCANVNPHFETQMQFSEIAHDISSDIPTQKHYSWVSFFGKVYDLAPLLAEHDGSELTFPIRQAAGTDISHWFDETTKEPKT